MSKQITNYATASYSYGENKADNTVSNIAITTLLDAYALVGEKKCTNTTFRPNENITFITKVTNTGTNSLYSVTIEDSLGGTEPSTMTYVDGSAMVYYGGNLTNITPTCNSPLTFTLLNPLASGESALIIYVAKVVSEVSKSLCEINNQTVISGRQDTTNGTIIKAETSPSVTLPIESYANVELIKEVSNDRIISGETFTYTITLTNSGNLEANNIIITDSLPVGFVVGTIQYTTNEEITTVTNSNYTIDASNKLTLPTSSSLSINVPPATSSGPGKTIVTITGSITEC
ncbi:MAG: hypothetical protein ACI4T8_01860 [Christensenellales bacterium]